MTKPKAAKMPADTLAALLAERDRLHEQRDVVRAAPKPLEEAETAIEGVVAALAARVDVPAGGWLAQGNGGDLVVHLARQPADHSELTAATLMAWAAPDVLAAALRRDLATAMETLPSPMSTAEKAGELAKLDQRIAAVEAEIATTWWAATENGMTIDVPDVSGAVLIGLAA